MTAPCLRTVVDSVSGVFSWNRVKSRWKCSKDCYFYVFFSCNLCNVLFWHVLFLSCVVLLCLNFLFVYVLLKMCLIMLYINDFLCHCVILTYVTQTFHLVNTFSSFRWNFNRFNVTGFHTHRGHSNKKYHWIK